MGSLSILLKSVRTVTASWYILCDYVILCDFLGLVIKDHAFLPGSLGALSGGSQPVKSKFLSIAMLKRYVMASGQ